MSPGAVKQQPFETSEKWYMMKEDTVRDLSCLLNYYEFCLRSYCTLFGRTSFQGFPTLFYTKHVNGQHKKCILVLKVLPFSFLNNYVVCVCV